MNRADRRRISVQGVGIRQQADHKYNAPINIEDGKHIWSMVALFRLADPEAPRGNLDIENLITLDGPGCFVCEQPYTRETAAKPCPGEPR